MINKVLANSLYSYARYRCERIRNTYSDPARLQETALKSILNKSKSTAFGRRFGFDRIKSVSDYQKRVPLVRYEDMKPWIDACLKGLPGQIAPGRFRYFALTSGTTSGSSKYIPVSPDTIRMNKKAALDCILFYLANTKDKSLFDGKMLFLGGSTSLKKLPGGILAGDMSGIMMRHMPFFVSGLHEPRRSVALIPDWEKKITKVVEEAKDKDMRLVSGVPSWILVLFDMLLKKTAKEKICDIWPNLRLFIYSGLDFSPYEKLMQALIGKDIYYTEAYFSSEAFIGVQDTPAAPSRAVNDAGLLLMLDYGVFYEFMRCEDIGRPNPRRYTAAEVETGVNYAIAVTGLSGLYSYIIGDTVKFVSKDPLRLRVTGRIDDFISALGEHVIAEEVEFAMSQAASKTGALINNFTVAPYFPKEPDGRPAHQWLVEFSKKPADFERFVDILDKSLSFKNDDYRSYREKGFGMARPRLYELKEGAFYGWHKERGTLGGQHKTPRLRNNRVMAEELIRLSEGLSGK